MPDSAQLLPNQRALFAIPREVAYFNCASLAPQLRSVRAAGEAALARNAEPWKIRTEDWFTKVEQLRELFARLIGVSAEGVALVPASSYGLAIAAANTSAGPENRVLIIADDFPSNVYTWRSFARRTGAQLLTVEREPGQNWTEAVCNAIDGRVRVVAVPHVHWMDGALLDLEQIGNAARAAGATFVVDASQSLGALPFDVAAVRPDYLVCVGYKWLLGPFSLGYLYVAADRRDGEPLEQNWIARVGADDFAGLTAYRDEYQPGARRFDVGQRSNLTLTPMAIAALTQLLAWGVPRISVTLAAITAQVEARARGSGFATTNVRGPHMLGITVPRLQEVAARLANQSVYVGVRGNTMRIAPHLHVDGTDLDRLFDGLKQ